MARRPVPARKPVKPRKPMPGKPPKVEPPATTYRRRPKHPRRIDADRGEADRADPGR